MSAIKRWLEDMVWRVESMVKSGYLDKEAAINAIAKANKISPAELRYWVEKMSVSA